VKNQARGPFDSRTTQYLRPDRPYVCGRKGDPCFRGPSSSGVCPHGEAACVPEISDSHRMKKVKRWVLLLFLGGILVTLASAGGEGKPFQQTFLDPGPLSHVHARFECNQCHSSDLDTWQGLLSSVLHRDGDTLGSQGCLHCHDQGSNAMFAHGVSPMGLRKKSGPAEIDPFMEQTECSICHLEHGHGQPLQALSDSRCQTCHHRKFDSFSNEHPEYSENYGNKARTFSFSHVDHARRHFGTEPDFASDVMFVMS